MGYTKSEACETPGLTYDTHETNVRVHMHVMRRVLVRCKIVISLLQTLHLILFQSKLEDTSNCQCLCNMYTITGATLRVVCRVAHCLWYVEWHIACRMSDGTLRVVCRVAHCLWCIECCIACGVSSVALLVKCQV